MSTSRHRSRKHKEAVIARDGNACYYCGKLNLVNKDATVDHIHPLRDGGKDNLDNLVLACRRCNAQKNSSSLEDYLARRLLAIKKEKKRLIQLAHKHHLI